MKYANSIKYIDSFKCAGDGEIISYRRISELCRDLGQINMGVRFIHVPSGVAGHGCGVFMESIVKNAGYRIGRIVCPEGCDSRSSVYICGQVPSIEDYNKCVAELKLKVGKNYESEYLREEIIFVLSLLICRLEGCEFIILEGTDKLDRVCAPFELTIIPTIYDSEKTMEKAMRLCDSIRCGTREVISGNQKKDVYNYISTVCTPSGQRLFIPAKAQFEITEQSSRQIVFNYKDREGFMLKTSSLIMRDCALTVIEAVMAMRREGIRISMSSVASGLCDAQSADSFEIISYTPNVIVDNSNEKDEISLMYKTFLEVFGEKKISLCIPGESYEDIENMISDIPLTQIKDIIVCGHNYELSSYQNINVTVCRTHKNAADIISNDCDRDSTWICYGGSLGQKIKSEIIKNINK